MNETEPDRSTEPREGLFNAALVFSVLEHLEHIDFGIGRNIVWAFAIPNCPESLNQ